MISRGWFLIALVAALLIYGAFPSDAMAQAGNLDSFKCVSGKPVGQLFQQESCVISSRTLFSGIVCSVEQTLSEIFSNLYCAMQQSLIKPLTILLTIFVIVFGILFLTGITQFTASEAMKALFKFALVFAFATQAEFAIGIAYKFFMSTTQEGISMVLSSTLKDGQEFTGDGAMRYMDSIVYNAIMPSIDANDAGNADTKTCQNAALGLAFLFLVVVPPLFLLVAYTAIQTIMVFVRAVLGYLLAITGLTFLMTLSPIFVPMALFHTTEEFYRKWLQYLISFSLQMIIVFAFLGLMEFVSIGNFLTSILDLVKPWYGSLGSGAGNRLMISNWLPCGICEYSMQANAQYHGMETPMCIANYKVIPPAEILTYPGFISMVAKKLIAITILAYVMEAFLRQVPEIAKQLAGTPMGPRLGGHVSADAITGRMAGIPQSDINMPGGQTMKGIADNITKGFNNTPGYTTPTKVFGALTAAGRGVSSSLKKETMGQLSGFGNPTAATRFLSERPPINPKTYFRLP